jgi:hypothetical protein
MSYSIRSSVLRRFGKLQRPVAWTILAGGAVMFVAVLFDIVRTGDAKLATLLSAVLVINDGFQAVSQVENELDSEASAEE